MELKTVFNTFSSAEANLVHGRLEAAGFEAYIHGELAGLTMGGYTAAAGGIRIQVPESRAEEAKAVIAELFPASDDSTDPEPLP